MTIIIKNKKLCKIGGSYGFIIGSAFVKGNLLDITKFYEIQIKEVENNATTDNQVDNGTIQPGSV